MISQAKFMGGAQLVVVNGADVPIYPIKGRVVRVSKLSDHGVKLPDARAYQKGGPYFYIINRNGPDNTLPLYSVNGILQVIIPHTACCIVSLVDNTFADGLWATEFRVCDEA